MYVITFLWHHRRKSFCFPFLFGWGERWCYINDVTQQISWVLWDKINIGEIGVTKHARAHATISPSALWGANDKGHEQKITVRKPAADGVCTSRNFERVWQNKHWLMRWRYFKNNRTHKYWTFQSSDIICNNAFRWNQCWMRPLTILIK